MRAHFIHNLRPDTFAPAFRAALSPSAYLLAPNNATGTLRAWVAELRRGNGQLLADNGNYSTVGQVKKLFVGRARALWNEVSALERSGRSLQARDVPADLRDRYRALAREAAQEAAKRAPFHRMLAEQQALDATRLIGAEDITMAVWLSLSIEPAYVNYRRDDYRRRNEAVAKAAVAQAAALPRAAARWYYPVASAQSYRSAADAGRAFARYALGKASMGFGAFMADDNYADYLELDRSTLNLPDRYPQRYMRTIAVARGFWDGYRAQRGRAPNGFHFLGLGAPVMMPLVALCAWGTREVSYDAMSPVFDAVEGTLYVTKPAYLKIRVRKVAHRLASEPDARWDCPCPFCTAFSRDYPMRYADGRTWYERTSAREVTAADLKPGGALYDVYPLFSEPRTGERRRAVTDARVGHNHWALEETVDAIRAAGTSRRSLARHAEAVVTAYAAATTPTFGRALQHALVLAQDGPDGLARHLRASRNGQGASAPS